MTRMEVERQIKDIEAQIAVLPVGSVVYKNIKGNRQPYLQWTEDGHSKSRYMKQAEREDILAKVALRKNLSAKLKELKVELTRLPVSHNEPEYLCWVVRREELWKMTEGVRNLGKRDAYEALQSYLREPRRGQVCVLYGLRGTGKTVMMLQAIDDMKLKGLTDIAYIRVGKGRTLADLTQDLRQLLAEGCRYAFVDEVTSACDFAASVGLLPDVFAMQGMKIVLAGGEPLKFWLAQADSLYGRACVIHTTATSFRECARLLPDCGIGDYIRRGGTMVVDREPFNVGTNEAMFRNDTSTHRYIDVAIHRNIKMAMDRCEVGGWPGQLREMEAAGELNAAIHETFRFLTRRFLLEALKQGEHRWDAKAEMKKGRHDGESTERSAAISGIFGVAIAQLGIEIREDEQDSAMMAQRAAILEALKALDLVVERQAGCSKGDAAWGNVLFTQPGMRYALTQFMVNGLRRNERFSSFSEREKRVAFSQMHEAVEEKLMADVILLDTMRSLPEEKNAFLLETEDSGTAMVVYSTEDDGCEVYEITGVRVPVPGKEDGELCAAVEREYGPVTRRCVLFRGNATSDDDVEEHMSVEAYLRELQA